MTGEGTSASIGGNLESESGQSRNRTGDTRIFSPLLYQLSYLPRRKERLSPAFQFFNRAAFFRADFPRPWLTSRSFTLEDSSRRPPKIILISSRSQEVDQERVAATPATSSLNRFQFSSTQDRLSTPARSRVLGTQQQYKK